MKKCILLLVFATATLTGLSQPYQISNISLDFYDASRRRNVTTEIYYPGIIDQGTTEVFPFLVFGHGFLMNYDSYEYLWEKLVPEGYICIFPTTATSIFVNHRNFGNDIGYLAKEFYYYSLNVGSPFYGNVQANPAVMGHSMGGGAAHLAAENYTSYIQTVISFAAAETNPSAIDAAGNADLPVYVLYGENDVVTPPVNNQIEIYNNSNSSCKTMINILGGGHCFFAEPQWACDFGDNSRTTITRDQQHDVIEDLVYLILEYELKGNSASLIAFEDSLLISPRILATRDCASTGLGIIEHKQSIIFYPNPAKSIVQFDLPNNFQGEVLVYDLNGRLRLNETASGSINIDKLASGSYIISLQNREGEIVSREHLIIK